MTIDIMRRHAIMELSLYMLSDLLSDGGARTRISERFDELCYIEYLFLPIRLPDSDFSHSLQYSKRKNRTPWCGLETQAC